MNNRQEAICVRALTKRFGQDTVLSNVNLSLEQGKIHGIIGRNGSGKTVLMKCICGFLRPESGGVTVFGKSIGKDCDFAPDTGMLIEIPGFLLHETGLNNLMWLAKLGKGATKQRVCALIEQVGLDSSLKKSVGKYSLGMRQRLGIAQALLDDPALLILDEPMNGLDKNGVQDMRALLLSLKAQGKTIVLASHFKQDIDELCDTVCEMDQGILIQIKQQRNGIDGTEAVS
ncbi:MAG: ATP-binding cassette domain-containing protein [Clostridia bacterium]